MKESLDDKIKERSLKEESRAVSNYDSDNYITGKNSPFVFPHDLSIQGYLREMKKYINLFSSKKNIN